MPKENPDFKQPPWVIGSQKEVMDWIEATHPEQKPKKTKKKHTPKTYKNLHIQLDLFDKPTPITEPSKSSQIVSKIFHNEKVEEHFNLNDMGELFLRALAKAKFRNTGKIQVDKTILYNHPEIPTDLRTTIETIKNIPKGNILEITALYQDTKQCHIQIQIRRIHRKKDHAINIQLKGEIHEEVIHVFLNYLQEKLNIPADKLLLKI